MAVGFLLWTYLSHIQGIMSVEEGKELKLSTHPFAFENQYITGGDFKNDKLR